VYADTLSDHTMQKPKLIITANVIKWLVKREEEEVPMLCKAYIHVA